MTIARTALWMIFAVALSACATSPEKPVTKDQASLCPAIKNLIAQHSTGFAQLRGSRTNTRYADIWTASDQLVGRDCQIWGWSKGAYGYVCSVATPDRKTAMDYYGKARDFTARCLGQQWNMLESVGESDAAHQVVFSRLGSDTVVAVRAVPVRGIAKSQWTTYYFIGDRSHLQ